MSKINYDLGKIKGVVFDVDGVLSPALVPLGADGNPQRMANIKDGYALQLAVRKGLKIAIISGASGEGLAERFKYLGINDVYLKAGVKRKLLEGWMNVNGLSGVVFAFGGVVGPLRVFLVCGGLPGGPGDSCVDILRVARYISPVNGGYGVARDLLEEILRAQNLWPDTDKACGW